MSYTRLISAGRALARAEHDDLLVALELCDELESLTESYRVLRERYHEVLNVRRSDDQVGLVCATCGLPVETEPCPDHSPVSRANIA